MWSPKLLFNAFKLAVERSVSDVLWLLGEKVESGKPVDDVSGQTPCASVRVCSWFICVCAKSGRTILHGCDGQCSLCHPDTVSTAWHDNEGRLHALALFIYLFVCTCVFQCIPAIRVQLGDEEFGPAPAWG